MAKRTSLDAAINRVAADDVITRAELKEVGRLANAKADPNTVAAKLDHYERKMTPRAFDVFSSYRAALATPDGQVGANNTLTGAAETPPRLPAWYPAAFDLDRATNGVRDILIAQGEAPETMAHGLCDKIVFTDADLTMIKSSTPSLLRHKDTGEPLKYPEGHALAGHLVLLGHGGRREVDDLKAAYPQIEWAKYVIDYGEFASLTDILRSAAIPDDIRSLKASDADPLSRDFVITARGSDLVPPYLDEYLLRQGVDSNGVLAVNSPGHMNRIGVGDPALRSAMKKAIAMAAIIRLYGSDHVKSVEFLDDTDDNLIAAMQLLPKMFPHIRFSFYDVTGDGEFRHHLVARTTHQGEMTDKTGRKLSVDAIDSYKSEDRYPIDHTIFLPH